MIRCIAFRHGQTDWNKKELVQGHSDILINETGVLQATDTKNEILKQNIEVDVIFSSDLIRCVQTAEIIFPFRKIITSKLLREINFGDYEGKNRWDVRKQCAYFNNVINNIKHPLHLYAPFPNGESCIEAFLRLINILTQIDAEYKNKTIALFTHGDLLELIFEVNKLDIPEIKHGSFFKFSFDAETMSFSDIKI